MNRVAGW